MDYATQKRAACDEFRKVCQGLHCCCEEGKTFDIKVEGDVGADPLWCCHCGCNLEIGDMPLTKELERELWEWAIQYGRWMDWESDTLLQEGAKLEDEHNRQGKHLARQVKLELGDAYKVRFTPSDLEGVYADKKK